MKGYAVTKMPSPADIKDARHRAGLTQSEAAYIVGAKERAWRYWESGGRKMDLAAWNLFNAVQVLIDVNYTLQGMFLRGKLDDDGLSLRERVQSILNDVAS